MFWLSGKARCGRVARSGRGDLVVRAPPGAPARVLAGRFPHWPGRSNPRSPGAFPGGKARAIGGPAAGSARSREPLLPGGW